MSYNKEDMAKHLKDKTCDKTKKTKNNGADVCPLCKIVVCSSNEEWVKHLEKEKCVKTPRE